MNDDTLIKMLRNAERELIGGPSLSADALLAAALGQRRRAAGVRVAAATLAIGAVVAAGAWLTSGEGSDMAATSNHGLKSQPARSGPSAPSVAELERELAVLKSEAAWRGQVVAALVATESTGESAESVPAPALGNADWVRVEAARSAALSWQYANVVEHEFHDAVAARREYQRLAERFPGTSWAKLAAVSLQRLSASDESPL